MRILVAASMVLLSALASFAWTVGDVVYLKSCSPAMTVTEILPNANVGVHWFAGQTMLASTFPENTVTAYYPCPAIAHAEGVISGTDNPPKPPGP